MKITINGSLYKHQMMKNMKFAAFLIHAVCKPQKPTLRELASDFKISKNTAKIFIDELDKLIKDGEIKGVGWVDVPKQQKKRSPTQTLEERKKIFYEELIPYLEKYDKQMIRAFYDYWSESDNKPSPKMRKELMTTWETSKRLARWSANIKKDSAMEIGRVLHNGEAIWEEEITNTETGW